MVIDLGSRNGLVLDGRRLDRVHLAVGEGVSLGFAVLRLEEVSTGDGELAISLASLSPDKQSSASVVSEVAQAALEGPAAALRLARDIESGSLQFAVALERSRKLLGSELLALVDLAADEMVVVRGCGDLAKLWSSRVEERMDQYETGDGRHYLIAVSEKAAPVRSPWEVDFLAYLASRSIRGDQPRRKRAGAALEGVPSDDATLLLPEGMVVGPSPRMAAMLSNIVVTAKSLQHVLLLGETGTGKELVAKLVHSSSPARLGPFLAINCAAIPGELLEAELFGVAARVATGVDPRPGLFAHADGGTLFLDEVGELPLSLQAKLLRVLQEREVLALGSAKPRAVKVRVVAASNRDLEALVEGGRFRQDLYYRLRGLQFHLPALRERKEDIPHLALAFAERFARQYKKGLRGFSRKALGLLVDHDWPGNVRELLSEIERAALLCPDGAAIESAHLGQLRWVTEPARTRPPAGSRIDPTPMLHEATNSPRPSLASQVDELERQAIAAALAKTGGNKAKAARLLGLTRNGLVLKIKRLLLSDSV